MGFLSKLFGKKDETDDFIKMIMENKRKADASPNYQVTCSTLKSVFYGMDYSAESFYNNMGAANELVQMAVGMCAKRGIKIPVSYKNLPVTFVTNEDRSKYGFVVAFDDARYECECNFVAMMFINGKKHTIPVNSMQVMKPFNFVCLAPMEAITLIHTTQKHLKILKTLLLDNCFFVGEKHERTRKKRRSCLDL